MSRKKMVSRIIFIAAFVLLIGLVLKVTDEIIRAKFIGDRKSTRLNSSHR